MFYKFLGLFILADAQGNVGVNWLSVGIAAVVITAVAVAILK